MSEYILIVKQERELNEGVKIILVERGVFLNNR